MKFKTATLLFTAFLISIILYDAFQQYYYLSTFDILETGSQISITELILTHCIRWLIWALSSVPVGLFAWKTFSDSEGQLPSKAWINIGVLTLISWSSAIAVLSIINIYWTGSVLTGSTFSQNYLFFIVQKGITFLFAYSVLILTMYSNAKNMVIEAQWMEISSLKDSSVPEQKSDPQVSIKIGNKMKLIPLTEVTWIESDDYCVKIHTKNKAYSLRKSMKSLEEQLAPYQFVRVHRGALLNLGYLDQVDFEQSVIKLQDASELPLSKSGAQVLRKILKASSI